MSEHAYRAGQQAARHEAELARASEQLRLDLLQAGIDVAGIVDPTPASDTAGLALAAYRRDPLGMGLSLVSMIPWAGDAVAKPFKAARLARSAARLRRQIAAAAAALTRSNTQARQLAAAATRAKQAAARGGQAVDNGTLARCRREAGPVTNMAGRRLPAQGSWDGPPGNSAWRPTPNPNGQTDRYVTDMRALNRQMGLPEDNPVPFRDGFPDFSQYEQGRERIFMRGGPADFTAADAARRQKIPGWRGANANGMTWHHSEDGTSMILVPRAVNNIPHDGGAALAREVPGF